MPINPPAEPTRAERISKVAARHAELVIFVLGVLVGATLVVVASVIR